MRGFTTRVRPGDEHQRGLKFPDEGEPDYLDFVYYAFVIG